MLPKQSQMKYPYKRARLPGKNKRNDKGSLKHSSDRLNKDQSKQNQKRLGVSSEQPFQKAVSIYNHRTLCIATTR